MENRFMEIRTLTLKPDSRKEFQRIDAEQGVLCSNGGPLTSWQTVRHCMMGQPIT
jgi:hypothetical protein